VIRLGSPLAPHLDHDPVLAKVDHPAARRGARAAARRAPARGHAVGGPAPGAARSPPPTRRRWRWTPPRWVSPDPCPLPSLLAPHPAPDDRPAEGVHR